MSVKSKQPYNNLFDEDNSSSDAVEKKRVKVENQDFYASPNTYEEKKNSLEEKLLDGDSLLKKDTEVDSDNDMVLIDEKEDKCMYWVFVVYGFSILSNYNAIMSSVDFLIQSMPGHNPGFYIGLGLQFFVACTMIFVIVYGHLVRFEIKNNLMVLIQVPITLMIPLSTKFFESPDTRFTCYVYSMLALGLFNSWQNCSVYYQSAMYPTGNQLAGVLFGMGLAGLTMNILRIADIGIGLAAGANTSGFGNIMIFYGLNAVFQLVTSLLYYVEKNNSLAIHVNKQVEKQHQQKPKVQFFNRVCEIMHDSAPAKRELFNLWVIYFTTFCVFVGVTNLVQLTFFDMSGSWFQIFWIIMFNFFDTIGRYLGGDTTKHISKNMVAIFSALRFVQVAIVILWAFYPKVIGMENRFGDIVKLFNIALFAFSNGYLCTLVQMWAPQMAKDQKQAGGIGTMLTFLINVGIITGTLVQAYVLQPLINK